MINDILFAIRLDVAGFYLCVFIDRIDISYVKDPNPSANCKNFKRIKLAQYKYNAWMGHNVMRSNVAIEKNFTDMNRLVKHLLFIILRNPYIYSIYRSGTTS